MMSGAFNVEGLLIWAFGLLTYISILANISIRVPDKHRKAVHGKTFLDMRVHRNKEQYRDYLFGVQHHQPLLVNDIDVSLIENDPKYEEIRLGLCIDTERQLLEQELDLRGDKPLLDEIKGRTFDPNSLELDKDEAHVRVGQMETKMIVRKGVGGDDPQYKELQDKIDKNTITVEQIRVQVNDIIGKMNDVQGTSSGTSTQVIEKHLTLPTKKMSEMSNEEVQFRIAELDKCQERMANLSHDDFLMAMQYRLFQVRRIFQDLFSSDASVEIIHNYQPVEYFETGMVFEYFILLMRRPYVDEFLFQEQPGNHEGFSVTIQSAPCASVTAGYALSDMPIFLVIYSPADADEKIDVVMTAQELMTLKMKILIRMIDWYKTEYENSDLSIRSEQSSATYYLEKWDDLRQQIDEGEWEPNTDDFGYTEKVVKIVPGSAKAYMFIITIAFIVVLWLYISSWYMGRLPVTGGGV
jgi:hypothetical protein